MLLPAVSRVGAFPADLGLVGGPRFLGPIVRYVRVPACAENGSHDEYAKETPYLGADRPENTVTDVCRELGVSEQTYHRWPNQYGGMKADDAKRLKDLKKQNATVKRLLAKAELEQAAVKELAEGDFSARVVISRWKHEYDHERRHSSLGYLTPVDDARSCTHTFGETDSRTERTSQRGRPLPVRQLDLHQTRPQMHGEY